VFDIAIVKIGFPNIPSIPKFRSSAQSRLQFVEIKTAVREGLKIRFSAKKPIGRQELR
jgi:hypothetical protein